MPIPGARYRFTGKGDTKVRLAFKGNKVVEAKNPKTGATHTPAEFKRDQETGKSTIIGRMQRRRG